MDTLNKAIAISPKSALCKFERASILHSTERYQEALEELTQLKQIVPKESSVYFLIGKVRLLAKEEFGNEQSLIFRFIVSWATPTWP